MRRSDEKNLSHNDNDDALSLSSAPPPPVLAVVESLSSVATVGTNNDENKNHNNEHAIMASAVEQAQQGQQEENKDDEDVSMEDRIAVVVTLEADPKSNDDIQDAPPIPMAAEDCDGISVSTTQEEAPKLNDEKNDDVEIAKDGEDEIAAVTRDPESKRDCTTPAGTTTPTSSTTRLEHFKQQQMLAVEQKTRGAEPSSSATSSSRLEKLKQEQLLLVHDSSSSSLRSLSSAKNPAGRGSLFSVMEEQDEQEPPPMMASSPPVRRSSSTKQPDGRSTSSTSSGCVGAFAVAPTTTTAVVTPDDDEENNGDDEQETPPVDDVEATNAADDDTTTMDLSHPTPTTALLTQAPITAELVVHDDNEDEEQVDAMRAEIEHWRTIATAQRPMAVVVSATEINVDDEEAYHNGNFDQDGTTASFLWRTKRRKYKLLGALVMVIVGIASVVVALLLGRNNIKDVGPSLVPSQEQLMVLQEAGLDNFSTFMDWTNLWEKLQRDHFDNNATTAENTTITILAPTNEAFDEVGCITTHYFGGYWYKEHLKNVLLHHIFEGTIEDVLDRFLDSPPSSSNISTIEMTMLSEEVVQIEAADRTKSGKRFDNEPLIELLDWLPSMARCTSTCRGAAEVSCIPSGSTLDKSQRNAIVPSEVLILDVPGDNNNRVIVHAIDHVLLNRILLDPYIDLDLLRQKGANVGIDILEIAGFAETATRTGNNYTFFVPSDAAFERLRPDVVQRMLDDTVTNVETALVWEIFGLHAVPKMTLTEEIMLERLTQWITSFNGKTLQYHLHSGGYLAVSNVQENSQFARVVVTDILMRDGIIHLVDHLLLSESRIVELLEPPPN